MQQGESTLGPLLGEMAAQIRRHRKLILALILVGVLQAVATKAPFLLLVELGEVLKPGAGRSHNVLYGALRDCKEAFLTTIGLAQFVPGPHLPPGDAAYQRALLGGTAVMIALFAVFGAITIYVFRVLANLAATRAVVALRNDLCSRLIRLSVGFFARQRTGELISAVTNDTNTIRHSFTLLFENAFLEPLMILTNVAFAASVHWMLGVFVAVLVPLLMLPLQRFGRKVRKSSGRSLQALGEATDTMNQMFSGYRTVKAFQLEDREVAEFEAMNERFLKRTMRMVKSKSMSQGLLYLIYMVGFGLMLFALRFVFTDGGSQIDTGELFLAIMAIGTTYQHVKITARSYNLLKESQGAMDRIQVYREMKSDIRDQEGALTLPKLRGDVEFRDVTFAYESEPVLQSVSFHVRPGEKVAFVGPSGAGKSTILNLLTRFYDPVGGRILMDGHDLQALRLDSYLPHLATVDQQPFLFNASIRENILLGRPGAGEPEMLAASQAALVHEFVEQLPEGYDTVVGERGSRLSGGQLQRITIARAIIRDPVILLLDEATSSLDTESEKKVQQALDNLMRGRTSFMVAHRLSTVRGADRIFVLERGRIVEEGNHDQLMARPDSAYRRLSLLQA